MLPGGIFLKYEPKVDARIIEPETAPKTALRYDRGWVLRLVGEEVGAKNVDLHLNTINAGSSEGPYHLHRQTENVYYVLEGTLRLRIHGENYDVVPGQAVFIPPGVPHSASNPGKDDARLLEIYAPVGTDFHEVAENDKVE